MYIYIYIISMIYIYIHNIIDVDVKNRKNIGFDGLKEAHTVFYLLFLAVSPVLMRWRKSCF